MGDLQNVQGSSTRKELIGGGFQEVDLGIPLTRVVLTDEKILDAILMKSPVDLREQAFAEINKKRKLVKPLIE